MSFNKVMILGYLGQDPEIRYTPAGMPVVNFAVATNQAYVDKEGQHQEHTEWHRIVAAGKLALACHDHLRKGSRVFVEGHLRTREWESGGTNRRRTEIISSGVQFLGPPPSGSSENSVDSQISPNAGVVRNEQ